MSEPTATPFRNFVEYLSDNYDGVTPPAGLQEEVGKLVASDSWLETPFRAPGEDTYRQYLLYRDPDGRFSVVSFVWAAGQATPVHDHTVWGAVGQLIGRETSTPYAFDENGAFQQGADEVCEAGDVIVFTPEEGDIHKVVNPGPDVAISIHIYGADIGAVERSTFDPETGAATLFVSGYSNDTPMLERL